MTCFTRHELHAAILLLEKVLWSVVKDKAGTLLVRLKAQFFSNETNIYIRLVPARNQQTFTRVLSLYGLRFTNACKGREPLPANEHVHKIRSHVRCVQIELEEPMVIPKCKG